MNEYTPNDFPCLLEIGFDKELIQEQIDSSAMGILKQASDMEFQETYLQNLKCFGAEEHMDDQYFTVALFFWEIDFFALEPSKFEPFISKIKKDLGKDYFMILNDDFYENCENKIFSLCYNSYDEDEWNEEIERLKQVYQEYHE